MNSSAELVIYHTSDIHGRTGFGARLAALVEPRALLVDCGDSLRGSSTLFRRDEPVLKDFALAPYAAQAVGNREFHYAHSAFSHRAAALPMPMLCSNLLDLKGSQPAPFLPELRIERAGVAIRLLALLPPQYRTGSGWERIFGWRFLAPETALERMLSVAGTAAHFTVLLSHLGLKADRRLAARFPRLDVIVGGHSHDILPQPELVEGVPIVQAGPYALYVGRLCVAWRDEKARLSSYELLPLLATGKSGRHR